jgi:hypothetical protein
MEVPSPVNMKVLFQNLTLVYLEVNMMVPSLANMEEFSPNHSLVNMKEFLKGITRADTLETMMVFTPAHTIVK